MNQIETQMNKLRLLGMAKSWTALQETRKLHELSLAEWWSFCSRPKNRKGTTGGSGGWNTRPVSVTKLLF